MADLMPIKDVAGLSQPITKLIETVGNAVGTVYEPTRIRKKAQAEADAAIIQANAAAEVQRIEYFASERIKFLEMRRQRNIEKITGFAQSQLPETVSDENVEEDWVIQYFNIAQDIGDEEMQMIWGKILAGEVSSPGSFSLRTLETVKMLRQEDAINFKKLCNFVWNGKYIIPTYEYFDLEIKWLNLRYLESLGLIFLDNVSWPLEPDQELNFKYFGKTHIFTNRAKYKTRFSVYALSLIGIELFSICEREPNDEYISAVLKRFSEEVESKIIAQPLY